MDLNNVAKGWNMIDETTTFELNLLAYTLQLVLLRRGSDTNYYRPLCNHLWHLEKRNGIPVSWYAGSGGQEGTSFSQMLKKLADEGRIILSGDTHSHIARLAHGRENELLEMIDFPHLDETIKAMQVLHGTRCKGVGNGWQVVYDDRDTYDRNGHTRADRVWKCFALARLRGWVETQTNAWEYVFVRITEAGRQTLRNPPKQQPSEYNDLANGVFQQSMIKATDFWKKAKVIDEKNIGDLPLPSGLDYPDMTVTRMLADRPKKRWTIKHVHR